MQRAAQLLTGAVLAGCLTLSACTSTPKPTPLPEQTTSPSPTETATVAAPPSATPPTLPAKAQGTSPAAAKAFARHYFDAINYSAMSGDTEALRLLGTDDCVSCDAIASNIEKVYNAGGRIVQEDWRVRSDRVLQAANGKAVVALGTFIAPEVIVRHDGQRDRNEGGKQPMTMFIDMTGMQPTVTELDLSS